MASSVRLESTICSVKYTSQNQESTKGLGVICEMEFPRGLRQTLFITTFRVLPIRNRYEITGLNLIFNDTKIGNLHPTPDWIKSMWSNDEFNISAIRLSKIAIDVLSHEYPLTTLTSAAPREHENVLMFSYEDGSLILRNGKIEEIDENNIEYRIETKDLMENEASSEGSPIFNEQSRIIGIYRSNYNKKSNNYEHKHKAISVRIIFDAVQKEMNNQIEILKQTDDNIWLEWIQKQVRVPIGTGGYAKVFKTRDPHGNLIALKVVDGFSSLDAFKSEAVALEKEFKLVKLVTDLENHSRIIQFFAFVRDNANSRLIIVMEYMEGGSLSDKIKSSGKFDKSTSLRYLIQILEGVDFLHKHSIYHSDIKPANILLTENDDIKICDFGIAVQFRTNSSATSSRLKGACFYMSPERINGESRSAKNDMWCVGATFVTMITGNTLNHTDKSLFPQMKIANYDLFINGEPLKQYLENLNENGYIRRIISNTLCTVEKRVTAAVLLEICKTDFDIKYEFFCPYSNYFTSNL